MIFLAFITMAAVISILLQLYKPSMLVNSLGMEFVYISPGEFLMGSINGLSQERPPHLVRITQPFYLGRHEVTQGQWEKVMGENPSDFKENADRPVEKVSWNEVEEFIQRLNEKEGVSHYRLPSEAEWEYAARAGSKTAFSFGDAEGQLGEYAWYGTNAESGTHPFSQLKPNAWGLYDMHGNVWEWVQDLYGEYSADDAIDPQGPSTGENHVQRGGSWASTGSSCRSASRSSGAPSSKYSYVGFRLLRTAP